MNEKVFKIFNFSNYRKQIERDASDLQSNISFDKEHLFSLKDIILMNRGKSRKIIYEMMSSAGDSTFKASESFGGRRSPSYSNFMVD